MVVFENIIRRIESDDDGGCKLVDVIYDAVMEVRSPVVVSLFTTVIVFVPLIFTLPLTSAILGDLAKVIVSILSLSVLVTIFIIPPLCYLILRTKSKRTNSPSNSWFYKPYRWFNIGFDKLRKMYIATLGYLLRSSKSSLAFILGLGILFTGSIYLLTAKVDRELLAVPDTDKAILVAHIQDPGLSKEAVLQLARGYEVRIKSVLGSKMRNFITVVRDKRLIFVLTLSDKKEIKLVKKTLEKKFPATPLAYFYVSDWTPTALEIPNPPLLEILVNHPKEDQKKRYLERITEIARGFEELGGNIKVAPKSTLENNLEIKIHEDAVREVQASDLGKASVSVKEITELIRFALDKQFVQEMTLESGEEVNLEIGFPKESIATPGDIENLLIRVGNHFVPLRHFVQVTPSRSYAEEYAENGEKIAKVEVYAKDSFQGDKEALRAKVRKALMSDPEINSSSLLFLDADREVKSNIMSLTKALAIAIVLIFVIIVIQFGRVGDALIVMLAIPMGFMGVSLSLFVFQSTLSINSMLGLILLCGTAVNNSIIFVDFFRNYHSKVSEDITGSLLATASVRFRPIMVTTITTIIGMLPVAFAFGNGGEILQPLGIAVSGGLGISTLFTLYIVPLMLAGPRRLWGKGANRAISLGSLSLLVFLSPMIAPKAQASEVSVKGIATKALDEDSHIKSLKKKLESSKLDKSIYKGSFLPSFSIKGSHSLDNQPLTTNGEKKSASLSLFQKIPLTPGTYGDYIEVDAQIELAKLNLQLARNKSFEAVYRDIIAISMLDRKIQIIERLIDNNKSVAELLNQNYKKGVASLNDQLRSQVLLEKSIDEKSQLLKERETKWSSLKQTINLPPHTNFPKVRVQPKANFLPVVENILTTHPSASTMEVRIAEAKRRIARGEIHQASSPFIPELGVEVNKALDVEDSPTTVAATVTWDLFNGGKDFFKRQQRELALGEAMDQKRNAITTNRRTFTEGLGRIKSLGETIDRKRGVLRLKESLAKSSKNSYLQGRLDAKSMMEDQNSLWQEELALLDIEKTLSLEILQVLTAADESGKVEKVLDF